MKHEKSSLLKRREKYAFNCRNNKKAWKVAIFGDYISFSKSLEFIRYDKNSYLPDIPKGIEAIFQAHPFPVFQYITISPNPVKTGFSAIKS